MIIALQLPDVSIPQPRQYGYNKLLPDVLSVARPSLPLANRVRLPKLAADAGSGRSRIQIPGMVLAWTLAGSIAFYVLERLAVTTLHHSHSGRSTR